MAEADKITIDELRYRRLKDRFASMVSEYEAKLVEAGIEKDILEAQYKQDRNNLIQQQSEELDRLNQRLQMLESQNGKHEVVNGEVLQ